MISQVRVTVSRVLIDDTEEFFSGCCLVTAHARCLHVELSAEFFRDVTGLIHISNDTGPDKDDELRARHAIGLAAECIL